MSLYPQAPQSIGKVLDSGFGLYRRVLKPILPLSVLVAVIAQLPQFAPYMLGSAGTPGMAIGLVLLVAFIAWFVVYLALYGGWIISMDALAQGRTALSAGQAFSTGLPKVLPMLGATILFVLALMVGLVLLVIPGLILMLSLFFFWYLILLENQGALDSLKSSHKLVWGNWWRTLAVFSVGGAIYVVAIIVVSGIAAVILGVSAFREPTAEQAAAGPGMGFLIYIVLQIVLNALLLPMWNAIMLVQFRDLQMRKSGADLAARAAAA